LQIALSGTPSGSPICTTAGRSSGSSAAPRWTRERRLYARRDLHGHRDIFVTYGI
jgi:hypothetical protein